MVVFGSNLTSVLQVVQIMADGLPADRVRLRSVRQSVGSEGRAQSVASDALHLHLM